MTSFVTLTIDTSNFMNCELLHFNDSLELVLFRFRSFHNGVNQNLVTSRFRINDVSDM